MGLLSKGANAQIDAWLETVSMAEIEAMEKQGMDVTAWKEKVAARDAAKNANDNARFSNDITERDLLSNLVDLSKLSRYIKTPRDVNDEFVRAVAGKLPLFGKDKKLQKVANGALIFTAVVQANAELWKPGNTEYYPAVLVFALDEAHKNNIEWLKQTAATITQLKESGKGSIDSKRLIDFLLDEQSDFCLRVPSSISGSADAWCAVHKFTEQTVLPNSCIPSEGIIPFVVREKPEENVGVWFYYIPSNYYV
jgi:hypothetical protein